ncbi:MAG: SAM-dependent methyltransferase [Hyphomicrobiaceae bacterium]|jgi:SAM-dependent methyltransferase
MTGQLQNPLERLGNLSTWVFSLATPERAFYPAMLERAALESGDHLLDLGCGTGDYLAATAYAEPGAILVGVDHDADSLEIASRKITGTVHPVELHVSEAQSLPLEDDEFDIVVASLLFGEMSPSVQTATLIECRRVLRPGGRLLTADWAFPGNLVTQALRFPTDLVRGALGMGSDRLRLGDRIAISGFHPPEIVGRFTTIAGPIVLLEAHVPLSS